MPPRRQGEDALLLEPFQHAHPQPQAAAVARRAPAAMLADGLGQLRPAQQQLDGLLDLGNRPPSEALAREGRHLQPL